MCVVFFQICPIRSCTPLMAPSNRFFGVEGTAGLGTAGVCGGAFWTIGHGHTSFGAACAGGGGTGFGGDGADGAAGRPTNRLSFAVSRRISSVSSFHSAKISSDKPLHEISHFFLRAVRTLAAEDGGGAAGFAMGGGTLGLGRLSFVVSRRT